MPNKYPGICYRCGKTVNAGEGVFEKVGRPQLKKWCKTRSNMPNWLTQHHECADRFRGTSRHYRFDPEAGE